MFRFQEKLIKSLDVVHDKELTGFLARIGVWDKIQDKKQFCKFCKEVITFDNLHSIFPESGHINIVCSNPECIKQLLEYIQLKDI